MPNDNEFRRQSFSFQPDSASMQKRESEIKIAIKKIPFELKKIYSGKKDVAFTMDQLQDIFGIRESEGLRSLLPPMKKIPGVKGAADKFMFLPQSPLKNNPDESNR